MVFDSILPLIFRLEIFRIILSIFYPIVFHCLESVLDSSAKIPSGLLRGNVNQLGDFDECLGVMAHVKLNEKTIRVQGKYCLANIDLYPSHPDMKLPVNMMQARSFIRGSMYDVSE